MMVSAGHVEVIMKRKNFKLGFRNASSGKQLEICHAHLAKFTRLTADAQADMDLPGIQTVVTTAHADPAAMTAAGLTVRADWQKVGVPAAPQNLTAAATANAGEIRLRWQRPLRRCFFQVEFTTNPNTETNWRQLGGETAQSFLATELTPGKLYWFRVRASNIHGESPWSGSASARPA